MDAVVHPSLREGLARVLPQALLVGRPVISYDIDGAREVVLPETGILLQPRDLAGLSAAILRLAADPALRQAMGREGRRRFADQFRHETMTEQLRSLYAQLLGAPLGVERRSRTSVNRSVCVCPLLRLNPVRVSLTSTSSQGLRWNSASSCGSSGVITAAVRSGAARRTAASLGRRHGVAQRIDHARLLEGEQDGLGPGVRDRTASRSPTIRGVR